jgi:hypothetical protein
MKTSIGAIIVHAGNPENSNPYRGEGLFGNERKQALADLKHNVPRPDLTYWIAAESGGARQIHDGRDVNWETSGIK